MTAPRVEIITLVRGDTYGATFTFDQAVSGFTSIRFTIRDAWATDETDNTTAAYTTTLTATGTYTAALTIPSASTLALQLDQYVYDVAVVVTADGAKYTTQRGHLRMSPDVTRG